MASMSATIQPVIEKYVREHFVKLYADHIEESARLIAPQGAVSVAELLRLLGTELIERAERPVSEGR